MVGKGKVRSYLSVECSECGAGLAANYKDGVIVVDPCPQCLGDLKTKIMHACNRVPLLEDSIFKGVLDE